MVSTHLNDGTFPFAATDEETHVYGVAGTCVLMMTVKDDDGGLCETIVLISVSRCRIGLCI